MKTPHYLGFIKGAETYASISTPTGDIFLGEKLAKIITTGTIVLLSHARHVATEKLGIKGLLSGSWIRPGKCTHR